ncbi:MAG: rod-binding protein [Treponemataceae bacterium]|nr:rod-binding protein [Treponemataceae bacterium]
MAQMNTLSGGVSSITNGFAASQAADLQNKMSTFQKLVDKLTSENEKQDNSNLSSSQILKSGRLNGDFTSGFENASTLESDKKARPQGFAANTASSSSKKGTIDKSSKLYEKSLELESYFVKMMLSSMRNTVQKSGLSGDESYASKMYEDMMYDEMAVSMTKNAGFGLADQIYLSLC